MAAGGGSEGAIDWLVSVVGSLVGFKLGSNITSVFWEVKSVFDFQPGRRDEDGVARCHWA